MIYPEHNIATAKDYFLFGSAAVENAIHLSGTTVPSLSHQPTAADYECTAAYVLSAVLRNVTIRLARSF